MVCPFCGAEMKRGTLRGRGDNYFLPEGEQAPKGPYTYAGLKRRNAVLLPPKSLGAVFETEWPEADWCEKCRKLIVSYEQEWE